MIISINLASPWTIGIITGLILMFITGAWNFAKILFAKQIIEKKFFDLFTEMQMLQRDNEKQISEINKNKANELREAKKDALRLVMSNIDKLIQHYQPPAKPKTFKELYFSQSLPKKDDP